MFATKAFGMGVDIKDIKNVYHYAPTGGLSDYIQEIGRVAREVGMRGYAITDYFKGDLSYSLRLRGMSQIREYQIKQLLSGLYEVYRSKGERRNFLISPESFTYIFNGKKSQDSAAINKLKIALLMLEKDLYDKNNYKVLVTRPRGIFTKAFVVIDRKIETMVLGSDVGCFFRKIANGRYKERSVLNGTISDVGDIYEADLKGIWEQFYPDLSFPSFKYFFFKKIRNFEPGKTIGQYLVLPKFLDGIYSRQKIDIILKKGERLSTVLEMLTDDMEYIAAAISSNFENQYFTKKQLLSVISERFGKADAALIMSTLFDILKSNDKKCEIKYRRSARGNEYEYYLSGSRFSELYYSILRKSKLKFVLQKYQGDRQFCFMNIEDTDDGRLLKLLSLFGYVTYNVSGGSAPEIFIRFNSPEKIQEIVSGAVNYRNDYLIKQKHHTERDAKLLKHFFETDYSDDERWDLVERYFLGEDILGE